MERLTFWSLEDLVLLPAFCCFYWKPGSESGHFRSCPVCYGYHGSDCTLSRRKKTGTDWLGHRRFCNCIYSDFSWIVHRHGLFRASNRDPDAGSCRSYRIDCCLHPYLRKWNLFYRRLQPAFCDFPWTWRQQVPSAFVLVACIINVFGDLILVAGFHMNAAGAAIATVFAQAISVVFAVVLLIKKNYHSRLERKTSV